MMIAGIYSVIDAVLRSIAGLIITRHVLVFKMHKRVGTQGGLNRHRGPLKCSKDISHCLKTAITYY
jgi:hypothetical protein